MLPAIQAVELVHHYGQRCALDHLDLQIERGELFAILGPNGGGKTTLFRLLSTLIPLQQGSIRILGHDVATDAAQVRARLGVVFQAPSLDRKLTVRENLLYQGPLYGLTGQPLRERASQMLERLGLADRQRDLVESLSGGLRRRVELAKGLLHRPPLLLLDEPSTGLDPGARNDLWNYLRQIRDQDGVTVVLTTHLLEEADKVDRLAILNEGRLVALDTPDNLRATVGGDSITIDASEPSALAGEVQARFGCAAKVVEGKVRLEQPEGHRLIARLVEAFPGRVQSITLGKPSLEDVFIDRTGHRFWKADEDAAARLTAGKRQAGKAGRR
jgi:ABC-2 type transport system ATP-binding protein